MLHTDGLREFMVLVDATPGYNEEQILKFI
jgi:hypothetical protein